MFGERCLDRGMWRPAIACAAAHVHPPANLHTAADVHAFPGQHLNTRSNRTPTPDSTPTPVSSPTPGPAATGTPVPTAMPQPTQAVAPSPTPTIPPTPATVSTPAPTSTPTLASMVEDVSPGVVQIVTLSGTGSGFIIDEDGLVVTNAHVIRGFKTVDVTLAGGQSYQADVLGVDMDADLALLDLRYPRAIEPVTLGDSDDVDVGEEVIAMGFPLGGIDILIGSPSVTGGIVSAKRVSKLGVELLQTDAAINPGNSGGPLFGRDGRVVGVNTAKIFESGDGRPVEGIGLAVAINEIKDRLELLARGGDVTPSGPTQDATDGTPTPVHSGSFVSVSAGGLHSCSLISDGSVSCWGSNYDGRSAPPPDRSFAYVKAGGSHTCGLKADGSVSCWGSDTYGQSTPPDGFFLSVVAGNFHTCGVTIDGSINSVKCWGSNVDLNGNYRGQSTPPSGTFTSVSAGSLHSCGVHRDGSVECWGSNVDLDGNYRGQSTPPSGAFTSVNAGGVHTCGVKTDGAVMCWGDDPVGQSTPPDGLFTLARIHRFIQVDGVRTAEGCEGVTGAIIRA